MSGPTIHTYKVPVSGLVVRAMMPERGKDPHSDVALPLSYRVEGDYQNTRVIIPQDKEAAKHPAYKAVRDIGMGIKPERSTYKVDGVITVKIYKKRDTGEASLSSRMKVTAMAEFGEEEESVVDMSFVKVKEYADPISKKRGAKEVS